jgi:hypothetical protein
VLANSTASNIVSLQSSINALASTSGTALTEATNLYNTEKTDVQKVIAQIATTSSDLNLGIGSNNNATNTLNNYT